MNVRTIQEKILKNRIEEAIECLSMAHELLEMGLKLGGKMNGLSSAMDARKADIRAQIDSLRLHMKEHFSPELPGLVQHVNPELVKQITEKRSIS